MGLLRSSLLRITRSALTSKAVELSLRKLLFGRSVLGWVELCLECVASEASEMIGQVGATLECTNSELTGVHWRVHHLPHVCAGNDGLFREGWVHRSQRREHRIERMWICLMHLVQIWVVLEHHTEVAGLGGSVVQLLRCYAGSDHTCADEGVGACAHGLFCGASWQSSHEVAHVGLLLGGGLDQ